MPTNSYLFRRPPNWRDHLFGYRRQLPAGREGWLRETGSLTRRLRSVYGPQVAVKVLYSCRRPAFIDECRLLGLPPAHWQLIREVLLHVEGRPLVLARTVLPFTTLRAVQGRLAHLGSRPLGEVIFAYPSLKLGTRQFSLVPPRAWASRAETAAADRPVWARRTVYAIHGQRLLVSEAFLN